MLVGWFFIYFTSGQSCAFSLHARLISCYLLALCLVQWCQSHPTLNKKARTESEIFLWAVFIVLSSLCKKSLNQLSAVIRSQTVTEATQSLELF